MKLSSAKVIAALGLTVFLVGPLIALSEETEAEKVAASRAMRQELLNDPLRPLWHFVAPEGICDPFDPNGAVYKDGVYHMWYIFQKDGKNLWEHVSSLDLLHWRWHSTILQPHEGDPEIGINSGSALTAPDGNVVISYQGVKAGICTVRSSDPDLNIWTKSQLNPVSPVVADVHGWYENGRYYHITGGIPPRLFVGDAYDQKLTEVGPFLTKNMPDVANYEDFSCPDFFKLGDKWVLLCLSHQRGVRYYVGTWDGKQFTPESHHRMNWQGANCFAPETLLDGQGRRIFWAYVYDQCKGLHSGTMTMPRVLTLADDKLSLKINPAKELESLRYRPMSEEPFSIPAGDSVSLTNIKGNAIELDLVIDPQKAKRFGVTVFQSGDRREETPITVDLEHQTVTIDMKKSSLKQVKFYKYGFYNLPIPNEEITEQTAPITVLPDKKVRLRIFLDKSIMEVFVDDCQCVTQMVYTTLPDAVSVSVFAEDEAIKVDSAKAWELFPTNQW
ncbi:MAG: glycoside hydrolase family 32 protein [Planctomycetia bacterium]|nr:glycoside hydrolase family 32 protein [Planctomycetia bacterium]